MSASHEMVASDVARIESIVRHFQATEIVETTNKRMIMWCPDLNCAKSLAVRINREGYHYEIKRGLQSKNWYLQAMY